MECKLSALMSVIETHIFVQMLSKTVIQRDLTSLVVEEGLEKHGRRYRVGIDAR